MEHDIARVGEICEMITTLGYDGLLRMEVGYEIVYCDFGDSGLRLLSQIRRPFWDEMETWLTYARMGFHIARAATRHYDGFPAAIRVQPDFSRMVSAYFYPVNISSPDADADAQAEARLLPRLLETTHHERRSIQRRVQEVAVARDSPGIDWQAVVDAVVSRYADRLALLAQLSPARAGVDAELFTAEVFVATNTYVDQPTTPDDVSLLSMEAAGEAAARKRCQSHYLQQVETFKPLFTPEDHLIYAAITQVTARICGTLFEARSRIQDAGHAKFDDKAKKKSMMSRAIEASQQSVHKLMSDLQWTQWEKCGSCAIDELCFVPMYPFGSNADHQKPRCLNESGIDLGLDLWNNYWQMDMRSAFKDMTEPF